MAILKEFKDFVSRGNVVDLAVGVIIGASFGKIVSSLVEDLIMPPIGKIVGNLDFSSLYIPLSEKITPGLSLVEARKLGPVIAWGNFVSITLNFVIVAACIFALVRALNAIKKKEQAAPAVPVPDSKEVVVLQEIRDLLKGKSV